MLTMTAFTIALLFVVWALARREISAREAKRRTLIEEQRRLEQEVAARTEELSELSTYLQTVREEEKSRLARDIHDELGGILVGAKMDVAWAAQRCKTALPEAAEKLNRALTVLDEGVEMKRRIIEELRPTLLDNLGISSALDWQVRQTCERAGLQCELNLADLELPPEVSIALYRIVQEALTNIVKYASARNVEVELLGDDEGVSLIVHDDGAGLPAGVESSRLSHGIIGMRQRVRALNGTFKISSRPGSGTTIEVFIPLSSGRCAERVAPERSSRRHLRRLCRSPRSGRIDRKRPGTTRPFSVPALKRLRLAVAHLRVLDALILRGAAHRVALLDRDLVLRVARVFARVLPRVGSLVGGHRGSCCCRPSRPWRRPSPSYARPSLPSRRRPSGCPTCRRTFPSRRRSRRRPCATRAS